ncbi:hypothetical protein NIES2107_56100 [Nostoc carneum NIES-2107]|nr:hypothetical protein NIES2107_56100 [Nostoc carneum NIES-2107]
MGGSIWELWEIAEIKKLEQGVPFEEVVKVLSHRTEKSVHLKAFKMGYLPKKNVWTDWEDQIIRENFPAKTAREIAAMLNNRSKHSVQQRIRDLGIQGVQWACTHSANRQFFSEPNILNSYWAGFIAADGCICEHKNCSTKSLKISITQGDHYLLERFVSDTEFTGIVSLDQAKESIINGRKLNVKPTVSISVSCAQEWFVDLEKNFNITPRKSLTLQPPDNLDRECSLAYIKGFFDGDGCAHIRKNGYLNIVFYGTFECLTWIKSICDEIAPNYTDDWRERQRKTADVFQKDKIFNYCIGEYRAEILAKEILKLDIPGMSRKWDKIQEHLKKKEQEFERIRQETQVYIFDSSKVYLGRLCKKGHDYQGTGKSLRRVGHGSCIRCGQINSQVKEPLIPIKFWIEQTKTIRPDIDINKFYLGSLCSQEHNFEGTGYSLRRLSNRICLKCEEVNRKAKVAQRLIQPARPNRQQSLISKIKHTKIVAPEIDTSQFYLATLCKHKHEYAATGKSLRRIIGGDCVECKGQRHLIKVQQFLDAYKAGKHLIEIDVDKYWLGELCKEKHNYQGTGLSLRDQKFNYCVECRKT